MGKSKDDHKRKRSSLSPRDESRSKRHRIKDDDKEHKSSKKHKSHTSSKHHSRKEQKSSAKRKHKDKDKDKKREKVSANLQIQELTGDDYFSKNNEFATWLKEEKRKFFADLSSDAARSLFSEFVTEWNNRELEPQYYEGIATAPRTSHNWNIKK